MLISGAAKLHKLPQETQEKLEAFLALLAKWNKAYNLTAIRDLEEMRIKHLFDSLAVLPFIKGDNILDVGTGPGLPGIPLALALPHYHFTLLDSNGKKTRFITQAILALNIKNVEVVQSRVEDYDPETQFQTIISRAFSSIPEFVGKTKRLLANDGQILAMKGKDFDQELKNIADHVKVHKLEVPGLKEQRHLVIISW